MKRSWALALVVVFATACGADDAESDVAEPATGQPTTDPSADAFPVTIGSGDTAVEIPAQPERIVSLSPRISQRYQAVYSTTSTDWISLA